MRQGLRSHLTYANVIATIALFLALGGGGFAVASHLVVNSSDIVDNQVYSADVRNDTLSGGGLAAADLRPGSVGASEVQNLAFQPLTLQSGWVSPCDAGDGSVGIAQSVEGVVYFRGGMCRTSGSVSLFDVFDVPAGLRPSKLEIIPVAQYAGAGRILVWPDGHVDVQRYAGSTDVYAYTSLAGASYTLPF